MIGKQDGSMQQYTPVSVCEIVAGDALGVLRTSNFFLDRDKMR